MERLRIEAGDTADVRALGLSLVQAHHWTGNMPAVVVLLIIAIHTAMNAAIFLIPGDITDRIFQLLTAAYGTSSTAFGIAYYLGSSRSSAQKDSTIAALGTVSAASAARRRPAPKKPPKGPSEH